MIYIVTNENHRLLEREIELAYQRRQRQGPKRKASCLLCRAIWIECAIVSAPETRGEGDRTTIDGGVRWLSRLRSDVEKLGRESAVGRARGKKRLLRTNSATRRTKATAKPAKSKQDQRRCG